jgi:hypothetical protein
VSAPTLSSSAIEPSRSMPLIEILSLPVFARADHCDHLHVGWDA